MRNVSFRFTKYWLRFAAFGPVEARNKMAKFTPGALALAALGVASLGRAVGRRDLLDPAP
jgi:hypothetical protein